MGRTKELLEQMNEVASGVADVTLELMEDSVDWQLAEWPKRVATPTMLYIAK